MATAEDHKTIARLQQLTELYNDKGLTEFYKAKATLMLDADEEHHITPKKQKMVGGDHTVLLPLDTVFRIRVLQRTGSLQGDVFLSMKEDRWYHLVGIDSDLLSKIEASAELFYTMH